MKSWRTVVMGAVLFGLGYFARVIHEEVLSWPHDDYLVCSLKTPVYDTSIDISSPNFQEVAQPLSYEVKTGGIVRIPKTYFATVSFDRDISEKSFRIISGKNRDVVGVAFIEKPNDVLIIHDFMTDESWPIAGYTEQYPATGMRGLRMLELLRQAADDHTLKLAR